MSDYEKQMLEFLESKYGDVLTGIKDQGDISDELDEKMRKALDEFKGLFQPAV